MFEETTAEEKLIFRKRLAFVVRLIKIYLPMVIMANLIYYFPFFMTNDTYFRFSVTAPYIGLGAAVVFLMYYSLQRTVTVYNNDLAEKFIYTNPRLDKLGKKVRFLFCQKEKLLELGLFAAGYIFLPRIATSPAIHFLVVYTPSEFVSDTTQQFLNVGGSASFLDGVIITAIVLPIMLLVFVLANVSAMNYWDTAQRAKEIDKNNLSQREQRRELKRDKKSGKKTYIGLLFAYWFGGIGLMVLFPLVFKSAMSVVFFVLFRIAMFVGAVFAVLFVFRVIRGFRIRRKFIKRLSKLCKEKKFRLTKIRYPYRSLFTLYNGEDFRITCNGKSYSCKILCSLKRSNPLYILRNGVGARLVIFKFLRIQLFSYTKSFKFGWEADCKKIVIVNPTPLQILLAGGNKPTELDNGDIIDGYEIYAATAFMNALERDVIDID